MIKIEKNVPIEGYRQPSREKHFLYKAMKKMEIGDSIVVNSDNYKSIQAGRSAVYKYGALSGVEITAKKVIDEEGYFELRVWRTA